MVILGVDPGLATVGWGLVDYSASRFRALSYGALITRPGVPVEKRLALIYDGLSELLEQHAPDALSVEELFFYNNITTGIVVAEARGVILLCAQRHGVPVFEYTPMQVKQSVTGYGKADKKQVIAMVTALLGLKEPPKPDDTADALAMAICHAHTGASGLGKYYNMPTAIGGISKKQ